MMLKQVQSPKKILAAPTVSIQGGKFEFWVKIILPYIYLIAVETTHSSSQAHGNQVAKMNGIELLRSTKVLAAKASETWSKILFS